MNLKPTKRNLVVQFFQSKGSKIIVAANETLGAGFTDEQRTRVKIVALSKTLEAEGELAVGNFVLLRPKPTLLPISEAALGLVLINVDVIEGIVLDDTEI